MVAVAVVLLTAMGAPARAQTVTVDHGAFATATGAGSAGTPSLSFTVSAGQNRAVFITAAFERDHCTTDTTETLATCIDETAANSNFASSVFVANDGANVQIQFTATGPGGSITAANPLAQPAGDLRFGNIYSVATGLSGASRASYSQEMYFFVLYEAQLRTLLGGAASGTITVTLPDAQAPHRNGDEAILSAIQFNHVNQVTTGGAGTGIVRSAIETTRTNCNTGLPFAAGVNAPGNWSLCLNGYDAGQAPVNAGDGVLLVGFNGYARSGPLDFATVAGFSEVLNPSVTNTDPGTTGATGAHFLAGTESDGFSSSFQFANGTPTANVTLQSQNGALTSSQSTSGGMAAKFTLTRALVDLSITKTNTPGVNGNVDQTNDGVLPGNATTYTLVISNTSINYVDGAMLTDPATSGLTKTGVSCTAVTAGAVCPLAGSVTVAAIESVPGIAIPTLPPNSTMTFTVTATVATGVSPVTNTAMVAVPSGYTDATPGNNSATDTDGALTRMTLRKISIGGVDSFGFTGTNGIVTQALTTTVAGTPISGTSQTLAATDATTTVTESTSPVTYRVSDIACSGLGVGGSATPDLANRSVTLNAAATAAGSDIVCTFTNTLQQADIQVVKAAGPGTVTSGNDVTYTLTVTNNGPSQANNVLLTDAASGGQDCMSPATTATCTATGGASCPSPTVPISSLLGSGISIPTLPVGGQVDVTMQCTVTASGL